MSMPRLAALDDEAIGDAVTERILGATGWYAGEPGA